MIQACIKRFFLLFCLFLFPLALLAAESMPPDIKAIIDRGILRVAILQPDLPPFHWHDARGNLQGYDISIAKNMAHHLGVQVEFYAEAHSLDDLAQNLLEDKADVIISYSLFTKRARYLIFSKPQLIFNQALLINSLTASHNKWTLDANTLLKIPNLTVGTLAGSHFIEFLKNKYPNVKIVPYVNIDQAFRDVQSGKIPAVFYLDKLIIHWLSEHPDANLYTRVLLTDKKMPIGMAIPWKDIYFINWINTYLVVIESNGTLDYYKKKFFSGFYEN